MSSRSVARELVGMWLTESQGGARKRNEDLVVAISKALDCQRDKVDDALRSIAFHVPTICYEHDDRRYVDIEEVFALKKIAAKVREELK